MAVIELSEAEIDEWEDGQNRFSRIILNIPRCAAVDGGIWGGECLGKLWKFRAHCMSMHVRNNGWSESCGKVCQMCDMGEDEMVAHVLMGCEK